MKKKMIVAVLSVLLVVALVFVAGILIPRQREFVKETTFRSTPDRVFAVVTDIKSQPGWRSDLLEIKVLDETSWTEVPRKGSPITFRERRKVRDELFEIEIIEPGSFNGYWTGTFAPADGGTRVVFKEVVVVDNPVFRLLSVVFVDLDKTMEVYVSDLRRKLGE